MNLPFLKKKRTNVRYYRSCDELWIYNFHKIMSTGNYAYMVIGWDEYSEIEYDKEEAIKIFGGIYNEYCKLTANNNAIRYYRTVQRLSYLKMRREVAARILVQITMRKMKQKIFMGYIESLKSFGFKYEHEKWDLNGIESLSRQLRASANEIGLLENEIKEITTTGEYVPFEKEVVQVEQALGRNMIDPKSTTVAKWWYMIEQIREISEHRKKQMAKHGKNS